MRGKRTPAMEALRANGVTLDRLAEEAGIGKRTASAYLGGHYPTMGSVAAAVRRLLPKADADEVLRLAAESWEARSGG